MKNRYIYVVSAAIALLILYVIGRFFFFIVANGSWYEMAAATLFIAAELFILIHSITYLFNVRDVMHAEKTGKYGPMQLPPLENYPPVAVVLCSYKEPLEIIENGLICLRNLQYPNKQLYLLDDSPYERPWENEEKVAAYRKSVEALCQKVGVNLFRHKWRGAKAGMINDFLDYCIGLPHLGSHAIRFQQDMPTEKAKYLVTFDADMNPLPNFVCMAVRAIESDPKFAFVQTPQYYTNIDTNRMANAAGIQQVVFYEYICKGKSLDKAVFCCGTNLIMRLSALLEVGGFDESCVTEDFATSLNIHLKGWDSGYLDTTLAFGRGPTDLKSYLCQQTRWAHGTLDVGRKTVFEFFKNRERLSSIKWWNYFISCSYYLSGIAFLVLLSMPCFFIFFDTKSYFFNPYAYLVICIPYFVISYMAFVLTLRRLGYKMRHILLTMIMMAVSFPQIIKAAIRGFCKKPLQFEVTPKGTDIYRYNLLELWPQMLSCLICAAAVTWGILRSSNGDEPFLAILFNIVWLICHTISVSPIIYFNNPVKA